jgi:hypothetical protein
MPPRVPCRHDHGRPHPRAPTCAGSRCRHGHGSPGVNTAVGAGLTCDQSYRHLSETPRPDPECPAALVRGSWVRSRARALPPRDREPWRARRARGRRARPRRSHRMAGGGRPKPSQARGRRSSERGWSRSHRMAGPGAPSPRRWDGPALAGRVTDTDSGLTASHPQSSPAEFRRLRRRRRGPPRGTAINE